MQAVRDRGIGVRSPVLFFLLASACAPAPIASAPSARAGEAPARATASAVAESSEPVKTFKRPVPTPPLAPPGTDVTAEFDVPEGLAVTVWASSPQLYNPTNIDVDARGRVWVAEAINYRYNIHPDREGFARRPEGDRIVILEDADGDGAADSSKVFAQNTDLLSPLGVAVFGNRVLVSSSPSLQLYVDDDGDDRPDRTETFLTGFGGVDDDHGLHAVTAGPDGQWYFTTGNQGPHTVKDRAGFTFRKLDDDPRPVPPASDDGHAWVQGVILRVSPDGTGLRPVAHNFRNNYEVALDSFGNVWQNDNDDDGNESCRFTYVMQGANYGYASARAQRRWRLDRREGQAKAIAHWHQEDPGVVPPTEVTGPGAPGGLLIYEGGLLPAVYLGAAFNADSGRSTVWAHKLAPRGAGWQSRREAFIKPKDGAAKSARWFRPSDVAIGPDGALYIADWYDAMVGGHAVLDGPGHGRILRVAPKGTSGLAAPVDVKTPAGAVVALGSPAVNVRFGAQSTLRALGDEAIPMLQPLLRGKDARLRARALWLLAGLGPAGQARVSPALRDRDDNIRLTALRALLAHATDEAAALALLTPLARDRSPTIRREVALRLRDVPWTKAGPLLVELAARHDGKDRYQLEAIGIGAEGKEAELYAALLLREKGGGKAALSWSPRFADLAWRLHPPAAIAGLSARADAERLPRAERERALVALAFIEHADAAEAMLARAQSQHPLAGLALALASQRAEVEWKSFGVGPRLAAAQKSKAASGRDEKIEALKRELASGKGDEERLRAIVGELAGSAAGGLFLIGEASAGRLSAERKALIAEFIFKNPDPSVRALASQHFERPSFEGAAFPPVPELLAMKGDAKRGREIFFGTTAACAQCHEMQGQGRNVGPALTFIGAKMGKDALFDAILNPSAGIAFGYEPWVVVTKDQQVYTGFVLSDGENLVLRDLAGEMRIVAKADIAHRERNQGSIMPDNIALGMKPQELVDVVEFLARAGVASSGKQARAQR